MRVLVELPFMRRHVQYAAPPLKVKPAPASDPAKRSHQAVVRKRRRRQKRTRCALFAGLRLTDLLMPLSLTLASIET